MGRRKRGSIAVVLLGMLPACLLPGCESVATCDVYGTIKEYLNGEPLAGVRVTLEVESPKEEATLTDTDAKGTFHLEFPQFNDRARTLTLSKAGYVDEVVDITLSDLPKSSETKQRVFVLTFLRKKSPER